MIVFCQVGFKNFFFFVFFLEHGKNTEFLLRIPVVNLSFISVISVSSHQKYELNYIVLQKPKIKLCKSNKKNHVLLEI